MVQPKLTAYHVGGEAEDSVDVFLIEEKNERHIKWTCLEALQLFLNRVDRCVPLRVPIHIRGEEEDDKKKYPRFATVTKIHLASRKPEFNRPQRYEIACHTKEYSHPFCSKEIAHSTKADKVEDVVHFHCLYPKPNQSMLDSIWLSDVFAAAEKTWNADLLKLMTWIDYEIFCTFHPLFERRLFLQGGIGDFFPAP